MVLRNYTPIAIRRQVEEQGHVCAYCLLPFGTIVFHQGKELTQRPEGDHFVPFSFAGRTDRKNLVAACQICNRIKRAQVFESVDHAQRMILKRRSEMRYIVEWVPLRAITDDSWAWASEYARFLIGRHGPAGRR